jgi:hypothetical protein
VLAWGDSSAQQIWDRRLHSSPSFVLCWARLQSIVVQEVRPESPVLAKVRDYCCYLSAESDPKGSNWCAPGYSGLCKSFSERAGAYDVDVLTLVLNIRL